MIGTAASAAAVGLAATAGCSKQNATVGLPSKWWKEADIVVVGAGGAGLVAAITAGLQKASVLLLEKQGLVGGDTAISAQFIVAKGEDITDQEFVDVWKNSYTKSMMAMQGKTLPEETPFTFEFTKKSAEMIKMLTDQGMKFTAAGPTSYLADKPGLIAQLQGLMKEQGVELATDTRVTKLVQDADGKVVGVQALNGDELVYVKANKGVILACGSADGDMSIVSKYLPALMNSAPGGATGNTGDGHKMVREIGGYWRGMDLGAQWFPYEYPTDGRNYFSASFGGGPGAFINLDGKRFVDEGFDYGFIPSAIWAQPYHTAYYVLDSVGAATVFGMSSPNARDYLEVQSLPVVANTIRELAADMQVDPDTMDAEITKYNGYVAAKKDPDFGRQFAEGSAPISTPPFYAVNIRGRHYFYYGGVAVDLEARVLNEEDQPIPGLWAVGAVCGNFFEQEGIRYAGGVGQGMTWGMVAAKSATAEASE